VTFENQNVFDRNSTEKTIEKITEEGKIFQNI
jgi:hypothetical protein